MPYLGVEPNIFCLQDRRSAVLLEGLLYISAELYMVPPRFELGLQESESCMITNYIMEPGVSFNTTSHAATVGSCARYMLPFTAA